jgi:DNA (cytosine-5)-methyltransferase 1
MSGKTKEIACTSRAGSRTRAVSARARADKTRALSCIDLFAGCGGLSLGLENVGFTPLLFSEINQSARETYMANRSHIELVSEPDIYNLTDAKLRKLKAAWDSRGFRDVDLVCGGPPCQGYSGIGHRRTFKLDKEEIPSNHLYKEMVRVVRAVKPKLFLFENVKGLLQGRWSASGEKGEIFRDVVAEFASLRDYKIKWELVHAKDYGVPQNRPRVLMVGIRKDIAEAAGMTTAGAHANPAIPDAIEHGFLPKPSGTPPDLVELLSDLEDPHYLGKECSQSYLRKAENQWQLKLRTRRDGTVLGRAEPLTEQEYSAHSPKIRAKFEHMLKHDGEIPESMRTKKFAQRVFPRRWDDRGPSLTATSLPDDYVHYSQPRAPTVREWARLQTFPDWYQFRGPRTTGGRRRAGDPGKGLWDRDVPKFTQIGNAVPVWLAEAVGAHFATILAKAARVP